MAGFLRMLLHCTLTVSAVAAVYALVLPLLQKRYKAYTLYLGWLILAVAFLLPFRVDFAPAAITIAVPSGVTLRQEGPPASAQVLNVNNGVLPNLDASTAQKPPSHADTPKAGGDAAPVSNPAVAATPSLDPVHILFILWAAGAAGFFLLQWLRHYRFMKVVKRWSRPVVDDETLEIYRQTRESLSIKKTLPLLYCPAVKSPMLIGVINPRILLPELIVSKESTALILRHECIHYMRRDLWGKLLLMAVKTLHWFNPMAYIMAREAGFYCETACDEKTISSADFMERKYYAETVIASIRRGMSLHTSLSTSFSGGKRTMKRRIATMLSGRKKHIGAVALCAVLLLAVIANGALALDPAETPTGEGPEDVTDVSPTPPPTPILGDTLPGTSPTPYLSLSPTPYVSPTSQPMSAREILSKLAALDYLEMTVGQFNTAISHICAAEGRDFLSVYRELGNTITSGDPLYTFYTTTLTWSAAEIAQAIENESKATIPCTAQLIRYTADGVDTWVDEKMYSTYELYSTDDDFLITGRVILPLELFTQENGRYYIKTMAPQWVPIENAPITMELSASGFESQAYPVAYMVTVEYTLNHAPDYNKTIEWRDDELHGAAWRIEEYLRDTLSESFSEEEVLNGIQEMLKGAQYSFDNTISYGDITVSVYRDE